MNLKQKPKKKPLDACWGAKDPWQILNSSAGAIIDIKETQMSGWYGNSNYDGNKRKKQMFNETEIKFIEDTAKRDLAAVNQKIDGLVNDIARLGKNLSDIKTVQSHLISILEAIEDSKEEDESPNRCC